jgi:hypothetical protein
LNPRRGRARALSAERRIEQGLAEMFGLVRGVAADGVVSSGEATRLSEWTRANPEIASRWPANVLARRLERIFADGRLESTERERLSAMLSLIAHNPLGLSRGFPLATDLPITRPEPEVTKPATPARAHSMSTDSTSAAPRATILVCGTASRMAREASRLPAGVMSRSSTSGRKLAIFCGGVERSPAPTGSTEDCWLSARRTPSRNRRNSLRTNTRGAPTGTPPDGVSGLPLPSIVIVTSRRTLGGSPLTTSRCAKNHHRL